MRGRRPAALSLRGLVVLALAAPTPAFAFDIPSGDPSAPASPAPVAPVAPSTVAASPAAAAPTTVAVRLRPGARGRLVRDLQRELRRRGYRGVRVDGAYGRATKAAVRSLQRRFKYRVTGIADPRFLRRMGLQATVTAAAPTPTPATLASPTGARYLQTFPVVGSYTYSNDYGAPRHQGRHEGNDIIAKEGTPVVAVAGGTITRMTRVEKGLGGIYIWLQDGRGNEYYYAHLSMISPGLRDGSRVVVGQVIGAVGQTGDARGTVDHLHFEIRPAGGGTTNPYTDLRAVDPKAR